MFIGPSTSPHTPAPAPRTPSPRTHRDPRIRTPCRSTSRAPGHRLRRAVANFALQYPHSDAIIALCRPSHRNGRVRCTIGRTMVFRFRYYEWDGTQDIGPLDPDDILAGLTDDLMNFGDLQHALRNLLQRGMRNPMGQRMQGLRDLLQQLRQQRRQQLDRFNLSSVFDDIQKKLDEIMSLERETVDRRLDVANR